jgi:hypothetical protein
MCFLSFLFPVIAQENDSLSLARDSVKKAKADHKKNYSGPRKASIMSAIFPGLGQAYNKKYWKMPIIYAGLAGFGYLFVANNQQYNFYRKNLIAENDNNPNTINTTRYSSDQLEVEKIDYRKKRDLDAIGIAVIYILNIIDANVDAHLKTFDVSDNLSIHIEPWQNIYGIGNGLRTANGLSIKINFK